MLKRRLDFEEKNQEEYVEEHDLENESEISTSSSEDEIEEVSGDETKTDDVEKVKKIKCMVLSGRGVNARQRHLMDDLCLLLPHLKKESKFDTKQGLFALNELADLEGCTHCLFFEPKKPQELFLWASKTPGGPSVRFHVQNIHTLDELHMRGNCMKNTRAILSFDASFEASEEGLLMKELLSDIFNVPESHRKTKPYFDHIYQFTMLDGRIWFRNYQIVPAEESKGQTSEKSVTPQISQDGLSLVEIGPRFVLHPVRAFQGSFGGKTIYLNPNFTPASVIRSQIKQGIAAQHHRRHEASTKATIRKQESSLPKNELEQVFE